MEKDDRKKMFNFSCRKDTLLDSFRLYMENYKSIKCQIEWGVKMSYY